MEGDISQYSLMQGTPFSCLNFEGSCFRIFGGEVEVDKILSLFIDEQQYINTNGEVNLLPLQMMMMMMPNVWPFVKVALEKHRQW
ncbi:hypothetical protein Gogos_015874, partial [Gossypium gossypioides]|nr:hypothetical protein [Gossypium gossypioides]